MSMPERAKILIPARIQSEGCKSGLRSGFTKTSVTILRREGFAEMPNFFAETIFFEAGILLLMTYE